MTYPAALPGVGEFPFKQVEKEPLLAFWKKAIADHHLAIQEGVRLDKVEQVDGGFVAHTSVGPIRAARVVLALGRRGTPRKLGVPGEDRSNVYYRLLEPEQYKGMRVTVVGGGNAAVEAALSLSAVPGAKVTLLHRDAEFTMARAALVKQLEARAAKGRAEVLRQARLTAVEEGLVRIEVQGDAGGAPQRLRLRDDRRHVALRAPHRLRRGPREEVRNAPAHPEVARRPAAPRPDLHPHAIAPERRLELRRLRRRHRRGTGRGRRPRHREDRRGGHAAVHVAGGEIAGRRDVRRSCGRP